MGRGMNGLARLGEEVSRSLEATRIASGGASRVRGKLVTRAPRRAPERPRVRWARIAGAVAVAAMMAVAIGFASAARALTFNGTVGAFIAAPQETELPLSFSDGTRIVLAPSTRARVASIGPKGARLLVESGKLHADVVHTGDAKWAVEAGPFEVRVTGTSFDVTWDPKDEAIVVALSEGSVVVTGCTLGEGKRVVRGEELRVSCKHPTDVTDANGATDTRRAAMTPDALPDAPPSPPSSSSPPASASAPAPAIPASESASPLAPKPASKAVALEPTAADLLADADAARYRGDFDGAIAALGAVRRRFPGSDAAASAAFELGRISFDARHDFAGAGGWFDTYLRERPNGTLAREALGRALEARLRAGDATQAERLAVRYLAAYPDGPHATLARKVASPAASSTASPSSSSSSSLPTSPTR